MARKRIKDIEELAELAAQDLDEEEETAEQEEQEEEEQEEEEQEEEEAEEEKPVSRKARRLREKERKKSRKAQSRKEMREALDRYANSEDEDEDDLGHISLRSIIGGDILQSPFFLRQVLFIVFVIVLMLIYTGNRYAGQEDLIVIDSLQTRLQETHYRVLTQSSELMNLTRQTKVEEQLRKMGDTTLLSTQPQTPPYEIRPLRNKTSMKLKPIDDPQTSD